MTRKRKTGIFILCIGTAAALIFAGNRIYKIWDDRRAGSSAAALTEQILKVQTEEPVKTAKKQDFKESFTDNNVQNAEDISSFITINGENYIGILSIPSLALKLPVNDEWDYTKLKESPCRYAGGITGSLVICAHDYNSHFGRLSRLIRGDKLFIADAAGVTHWYNIEATVTIKETDITAMVNSPYDLSLFTCTADGRYRITVRCMKINFENTPFPGYAVRKGQTNGNVLLIQKYLNIIRTIQPDIPHLDEDGSFGPATDKAVRLFQRLYDLDVDGSVGPVTWNKISEIKNTLE